MQPRKIEISPRTVLMTVLILFVLYMFYNLRDLLVLIFISAIFTAALNPIVSKLEQQRIPRTVGILSVYAALIAFLSLIISLVIPPLVRESANLISRLHLPQLPVSFEFSELQNTYINYNDLLSGIGGSLSGLFGIAFSTFSGILIVFTFFVMTFYMLVERNHLHIYLLWLFGSGDSEKRAKQFLDKLEHELGGWVRGQLLLMFVIGITTYIGLALLGIPYALPLAILAGLLEVVPNIGPTVASVPAIALAFFTLSPASGVITILFYVLVQQLENNILVPKIMSASINISPLIAIIVLIAGITLGGVKGAVLSLPTYILLRSIIREVDGGKNPFQVALKK